jgi:hypothetical protein
MDEEKTLKGTNVDFEWFTKEKGQQAATSADCVYLY